MNNKNNSVITKNAQQHQQQQSNKTPLSIKTPSNKPQVKIENIPLKEEQIIVLQEEDIQDGDDENDLSEDYSDSGSAEEINEKFRNLKLRRTDSISKYKAKQLLKLQQEQQEREDAENETEKGDDSSNKSYTPPPSSLISPFNNVNGDNINNTNKSNNNNITTSPPIDPILSSPINEEKRQVPLIVIPPSTIQEEVLLKKKKQSLDSDDEDFGYDDNLQFTVVVKKQSPRSEILKPINNPIPKRPIFQVDPSKEIINLSLIALRTSIRIGFDNIDTLTQNDFIHFKKYRVSISEKRTVIKDFSPNVFYILRNRLNIDQTEFLKSWSAFINFHENEKKIKSNSGNSGNSDFLVYSSDKKYIMKIISKSDSVKLRTLLPHYYNYLIYNPNSLLEKYLGLFRIGNKSSHSYVVILSNLYESNITTNELFTQSGQNISSNNIKKQRALKKFLNLDKFTKQTILQQSEKDATFLASQDLVDYSFIVGVINNKEKIIEIEKEININSVEIIPNTPPPSNNNNDNNINKNIDSSTSTSSSTTITPPSSPSTNSNNNNNVSPTNSIKNSNNSIMDPIKTVPRLLYFIEDVEIVVKSNNLKISKSLKKSFAALPRSWSLEDVSQQPLIDDSSSEKSPPTTPKPTTKQQNLLIPGSKSATSHLLSSSTPSTSLLAHSLTSLPTLPTNDLSGSPNSNSVLNGSNGINLKTSTPVTSSTTVQFKNISKVKNTSYQSANQEPNEIYYFGIVDFLSKQKKMASLGKQSISPNANQYLKKFISNIKESFFNLVASTSTPSSPSSK